MVDQPPIEAALGAPLVVREHDEETVVGIRVAGGEFRVLKRY